MKTKLFSLLAFGALIFAPAQTTLLSQGFDDITTLTGWVQTNQSTTVGTTGWFQGNAAAVFPSQAGAPTSYIGANFNNTTGNSTISNWLITPQLMIQNGDVLKFWTRTTTASAFPDRLEVRLSGATYTAPSGPTGVGSLTTLLTSVNPGLTVGGYPDVWTEITVTVAGFSATPAAANIGFRYFVTSGGPSGANSDYIGIDTMSLVRPQLAVSDAAKNKIALYPNPTSDYLNINSNSKVSKIEIFDISGKKVNAELIDGKVDVKNLSNGSYIIKMSDASGTTSQKFIKE